MNLKINFFLINSTRESIKENQEQELPNTTTITTTKQFPTK